MKPDYGIDAPGLVRAFFLIGTLCLAGVFAAIWLLAGLLQSGLILLLGLIGLYTLFMGSFMVWGSRVEKVREADLILDRFVWTGSEQVLDVGCGRGLMLVSAAKRLTTGRAIGVDIWNAADQSCNSEAGAYANAALENVRDRVFVETGDMRALPFGDEHFDIVLSNWAVHNLPDQADRQKSIAEMVRVLRPGGTLMLTDIVNRQEYLTVMRTLSLDDVHLIVLSEAKDRFRSAISFGSFQPATVMGRKREG